MRRCWCKLLSRECWNFSCRNKPLRNCRTLRSASVFLQSSCQSSASKRSLPTSRMNSVARLKTCFRRMPTCIDGLLDALLISLGSPLTTFPLNCRKRRKLWLKGSWSFGISGGATRGQLWWLEFYPDLVTKAAALGHSLIQNHPCVDVKNV